MVLLIVQSIVPFNQASAVDGLSINATVGGQQTLEIGRDGKVTTTVTFDLLPGGTAQANVRKPMDVVIVFDKSGSMSEEVSKGKTKLQLAKEAVQKAVDTFKTNSKNGNDRYGIVAFDSDVNSTYTISTLQSDPNKIIDKIKNAPAEGGTNYTDALKIAENILKNSTNRSERDQYIIFMTDGKPTNSSKQVAVNGNYFRLIEHSDYYYYYGYKKYYEKYYDGKFVSIGNNTYVISDSKVAISGTKTMYYDSNGDRNTMAIEHNNNLYYHSHYNQSVPNAIKQHGREQAQSINNNKITLLSIGFGDRDQLDMNYLAELSSMSNGKAERATSDNLVKMFEDISTNISAEYPSLSNGFIRFKLPSGVTVQQTDAVSIVDDSVIMNLKDIKYNPNPPNAGDRSLYYELPVTFTATGDYNFSFDILYNSGNVTKKGIPFTVKVKERNIPLESISFNPKQKTIYVGEKFKVEDYLSFVPFDATNKLIGNVTTDYNVPIIIDRIGHEWYITGKDIGYTDIKAIADENSNISATMRVVVKRNTDFSDGGETGEDDQEGGSDPGDGSENGGGNTYDKENKW